MSSVDKLRQLMALQGISAADLIEKTDWTKSTVYRILNYSRELTSNEIEKLSKELGVPVSYFFTDGATFNTNRGEDSISHTFADAARTYFSSNRGAFKDSEVGNIFRKVLPKALLDRAYIDSRVYKIEGSIGQGQFAEVPWVCIFNRSITTSATQGVYIVYLYSADGKRLYLSLNQGYTYFSNKAKKAKDARSELTNMANIIRKDISVSNSRVVDKIDLSAANQLGRGYQAGHIIGYEYEIDNMPSDEVFIGDVRELLGVYEKIALSFGARDVNQYYDFLIACDDGSVLLETVETEMTSDNAADVDVSDMRDEPKVKSCPVLDGKGHKRYPRDPVVSARALAYAGYRCEVDFDHETFISRVTRHPYVESHHLIPLCESDKFA